MTITETFNQAVQDAQASLPALPKPSGEYVTAADLRSYIDGHSAVRIRAYADDLLGVIAAIQSLRESNPGLDCFFRQRGIVTWVRTGRS